MRWPLRRRWEVWVTWRDERNRVASERLVRRCWTSFGAAAEVDQREHSTAVGAFVAGTVIAGRPYVPSYEVRDVRTAA